MFFVLKTRLPSFIKCSIRSSIASWWFKTNLNYGNNGFWQMLYIYMVWVGVDLLAHVCTLREISEIQHKIVYTQTNLCHCYTECISVCESAVHLWYTHKRLSPVSTAHRNPHRYCSCTVCIVHLHVVYQTHFLLLLLHTYLEISVDDTQVVQILQRLCHFQQSLVDSGPEDQPACIHGWNTLNS